MDAAGSDHGAAVLAALAHRADGIRLPPAVLPGWSSFCAREYTALVAELAVEVWALRAALAAARWEGAP